MISPSTKWVGKGPKPCKLHPCYLCSKHVTTQLTVGAGAYHCRHTDHIGSHALRACSLLLARLLNSGLRASHARSLTTWPCMMHWIRLRYSRIPYVVRIQACVRYHHVQTWHIRQCLSLHVRQLLLGHATLTQRSQNVACTATCSRDKHQNAYISKILGVKVHMCPEQGLQGPDD